jgi:hypothetical protein
VASHTYPRYLFSGPVHTLFFFTISGKLFTGTGYFLGFWCLRVEKVVRCAVLG